VEGSCPIHIVSTLGGVIVAVGVLLGVAILVAVCVTCVWVFPQATSKLAQIMIIKLDLKI
jgi:hypothetical protein